MPASHPIGIGQKKAPNADSQKIASIYAPLRGIFAKKQCRLHSIQRSSEMAWRSTITRLARVPTEWHLFE
jgi:hypothetical protein